MYMWSCFAAYGNPTPNITRNITWEPYNEFNYTFLIINWYSHLWFRYRQSQYGFWNEYFPRMAKQNYYYPTPTPTPAGYEYVIATGCVSALLVLLLGTMGILIYLLWYQHRKTEEAPYRHNPEESPLTFTPGLTTRTNSTSVSNVSHSTAGMSFAQWSSQNKPSMSMSSTVQHSVI